MKVLPVITALFVSTISLFAERISGRGEAPYTNPIAKPGKEVEAAARKEAIYNAVDRLIMGDKNDDGTPKHPAALREQFQKFGKTLSAEELEAKGIVTESRKAVVIADPKARKVTVLFEGTLDIQALRDKMNSTSATEGGTDLKLSKVAAMVLFTVRETTENFVFDDKVVQATKRLDTVEGDKNLAVSGNDNSVAAQGSASRLRETKISVESGVAKRTDKQKFALDIPSKRGFSSGMKAVFTAKGFKKVKDGAFLESSAVVDEAFGTTGDLPPKVLRQAAKEAKEDSPNLKYLIIGTVDFSIPTFDKVNGQHLYTGRVTGDVYEYDEGGGNPDPVAALEPVQVKQGADTQQDAKNRVLQKLSEETANNIITKLKNKEGI